MLGVTLQWTRDDEGGGGGGGGEGESGQPFKVKEGERALA